MTDETKAKIEELLHAERNRLTTESVALSRRLHAIDGQIDALQGDTFGAEWHRLASVGSPDEHAAWVRMMAARVVESGTPYRTNTYEEWNTQVAAEVERLRSSQGAA